MKYSRFELLALIVAAVAVVATIIATAKSSSAVANTVGQLMILVVLFGGLHYGRRGALISFLIATGFYAIFAFGFRGDIGLGTAVEIFFIRVGVFAVVALVAGELNARLKYLFLKLEHQDYIDSITSLYNAKCMSKLIAKYVSEFDRYGAKFSVTSFTVDPDLLEPLKKKAQVALVKDLGNSVIRGNIREADEAARLEGTTFTVLFPNTNFDGATCATIRVKGKITSYLDRHGLGTEDDKTIQTDILEYPKDKESMEVMVVSLQNTDTKEKPKNLL